MGVRRKALRPILAMGLGMGLVTSLAAEEGHSSFTWLGLRPGTLFFDPSENAGSAVFLGVQGGMVFEGRRHGFTLDGFQYTTKSSIAPGVNLRHRGASATFLSGLSEDPAGPFWPYLGLGLGTLSVTEVDPLTLAQFSTRATTAHASLGFVQRPGGGFFWGMEGRAVYRLPIKALQEIQASLHLGYLWGGRTSAPLGDVSSTPPPQAAPLDATVPPPKGSPSVQSPAPLPASASLIPSPAPTAKPTPTSIPAAPAPAPLAPVLAPALASSAPARPEPASETPLAAPADLAPPSAPTPSVQTPAPSGVMARPMPSPNPTAMPPLTPAPLAPGPAPLAPVLASAAPARPETASEIPAAAPPDLAPPSTPTPSVQNPAPSGVKARPMPSLTPTAAPPSTPAPIAPEPAPFAPVSVSSASPLTEPEPVMTGTAPAEPAPSISTAAGLVEALRRGDIPRAQELSRKRIEGIPPRQWTLRLEVARLTITLKNAAWAFPGVPDLFIAPIQLRGGTAANQLFLGDYSSREEAERGTRAVPTYFLKGRQRPIPFQVSDIPARSCPMARPVPSPTPTSIPAPKGISVRHAPSCLRCH